MPSIRPLLLAALVTQGCAFVSVEEIDALTDQLDTDLDGTLDVDDCDIFDPTIHPRGPRDEDGNFPETESGDEVADGIDNDCSGGDLVDEDGDTYPVIDRDTYRAMVQEMTNLAPEQIQWPAGLATRVDCDDQDPEINPGKADTPYDGIDQDCGCAEGGSERACNDFDRDLDGQFEASVTQEIVEAYVAAYPAFDVDPTDPSLYGDCDDANQSVFLGAAGDLYYDGIDTDCDGANDFDADGDGYIPDAYAAALVDFVARYHGGNEPDWGPGAAGPALTGDCLDQLPSQWTNADPNDLFDLASVDPAGVNPGVDEVYLDGIDANCDGANDFDQDGDGVARDGVTDAELQAYIRAWSGFFPTITGSDEFPDTVGTISRTLGDCNDEDDAVFPGAVEALFAVDSEGAPIDYDCDFDSQTTPFEFGGYLLGNPGDPKLVATPDAVVLGFSALVVYDPLVGGGWNQRSNYPTTLSFDPFDGERLGSYALYNQAAQNDDDLVVGLDLLEEDPYVWAGFVVVDDVTRAQELRVLRADTSLGTTFQAWGTAQLTNTQAGAAPRGLYADLDLGISPSGDVTAVTVGGNVLYDQDFTLVETLSCPVDDTLCVDGTGYYTGTCTAGTCDFTDFPLESDRTDLSSAVLVTATFPTAATFDLFDAPTTDDADFCLYDRSAGPDVLTCDVTGGCTTWDLTASTTTTDAAIRYEGDLRDGRFVLAGPTGVEIRDALDTAGETYFSGTPVLSADLTLTDTDGDGVDDHFFIAAVLSGTPNTLQLGHAPLPTSGLPGEAELSLIDVHTDDTDTTIRSCTDGAAALPCVDGPGRTIEPTRVALVSTPTRLALAFVGDGPTGTNPTNAPMDAIGWSFLSFYPDLDGDGFPGAPSDGTVLDASILDPDDADPSVLP